MTELDDDLPQEVFDLVQEFGTDAIFFEEPGKEAGYDPAAGEVTGVTPVPHTHKVSPPYHATKELREKTGIKTGGKSIVLPTKGITFTPVRKMRVQVAQKHPDGTVFDQVTTIMGLMPISTGTVITAYEILLEGD